MSLTIGQITYANCTPIFASLKETMAPGEYRFVSGVPAVLNRMLASGEIDVCPSSSVAYALDPGRYLILPDLSISAVGPVKSVLLFSRVPLERLDGASLGLTIESDTSVRLLHVILSTFCGYDNRYERTELPYDEALERYPALLLIGDAALKGARERIAPHIYDLGELWRRYTGLPFVFALWLVLRDTARRHPREVAHLHRQLLASKHRAYGAYREIAGTCPERAWYGEDELVAYWNTISYDLTPAHREGLVLFFRHAAGLGMLPAVPEIDLFAAGYEARDQRLAALNRR